MRKAERERRERQRLWIENLAAGRVLASQFLILEKAGSGAEGVVYLVRDQFTRTEKAIKFYYNPEDAWHLKRLAHKMTHLQHENIVRHHGVGQVTHAGQPVLFLIMEPYDGHVLSHYQDRFPGRRLGLFEALKYFTDVIQALVYAHSRGFVHEDIHRENVVLHHDPHRRGREYVAKLNDFFPAGRTFEVKRRQVDIREAGFLLYEMLTGKMEYAARHLKTMPPECADLIRRCVHRDRARRYKHPRRVLEVLRDMQWVS
jgi:serine/threonine protein kinase